MIAAVVAAVLTAVIVLAVLTLTNLFEPQVSGLDLPPIDRHKLDLAALAAGEKVTFIGSTMPLDRQFRMLLEPNQIGPSQYGDDICSFHAFQYSMLEVCGDPGIDRYKVRLKLRRQYDKGGPQDAAEEGVSNIGFYFGHTEVRAAAGHPVHAMFSVQFRDFDREAKLNGKPPQKKPVSLLRTILQQKPGVNLPAKTDRVATLRFEPSLTVPGRWRVIEAELTPERVRVWWQDDADTLVVLADWTVEQIRHQVELMRRDADAVAPGAGGAIPDWTPRTGFGVFNHKSSVGVKDVVVTPIPLP
ncbi:MAG: hypothetical protein ABGY75_10715 [Gemmataceae bacterium]